MSGSSGHGKSIDVPIPRKCPKPGCPETKAYHLKSDVFGTKVYCPAGHSGYFTKEEMSHAEIVDWLDLVSAV